MQQLMEFEMLIKIRNEKIMLKHNYQKDNK